MGKPATLWHYTDAAGLFGIVQSGQLRFGDARLLNDCTEQLYAERLLREVVAKEERPDRHGVIASALNLVDPSQYPFRLYICSLSETKESISQWQRYGADGAGYCIEFDVKKLDELLAKWSWRKRMRYKPAEQRDLFRRKLRAASVVQSKWMITDSDSLQMDILRATAQLEEDLDDAMLQIKNPFFADEREWRYILVKDARAQFETPSLPEQFATRGTYVKPFIPLPASVSGTLPVTRVVCGPKLNFEIAQPATSRFLRSRGYGRVRVEQSKLTDIWR